MDKEFRKWYDAREGIKSESFAYDVWQAAWEAVTWEAKKPTMCICENPQRCNTFDKCMKKC